MAFPVVGGRPDYSGNFIPELWSGKIVVNLYDDTVLAAISNTDYEGEIKKYGNIVNIRQTPDINIRKYVKGQRLSTDNPDKPKIQLHIDKGLYFSVNEDDIDKIQTDEKLMDLWTKDASEQFSIKIDQEILPNIPPEVAASNKGKAAGAESGDYDLGDETNPLVIDKNNVIELLTKTNAVLNEANCPKTGRYIVVTDKIGMHIKNSELKDASITGDSTGVIRNGRIGMIDDLTIYTSHNLLKSANANYLLAGHKMGLTFALQMTEMETLRVEGTFGDILRGLKVFGYKVVKPETLVSIAVAR